MKTDNLEFIIEQVEQNDSFGYEAQRARDEFNQLKDEVEKLERDNDIQNTLIVEYQTVVHFLMNQIENIITDVDDFDFTGARGFLKKINIDLDEEYFIP